MVPQLRTKKYYVRNYRCNNPNCCDGEVTIQVVHTTNTKKHRCSYCGTFCEYVNDVKEVELPVKEL